jgi:acyl-coenzyme A thioesterase PaaI-like protein
MSDRNRLARSLAPIDWLPRVLQGPVRSAVMGRVVPFVGTAGLAIDELTPARAVVRIADRRRVQNHIGSVHAAAMALLAETATGFVVGMNVPDSGVPVIKTLRIDFVKRASGALRAVAELTPEQIETIRSTEKGEVAVRVTVTDAEGKEPVVCEMVWAWTPKRR